MERRELALQGLYAWQLSGEAVQGLRSQLADSEDFDKADAQYFDTLLRGTIEQAAGTIVSMMASPARVST